MPELSHAVDITRPAAILTDLRELPSDWSLRVIAMSEIEAVTAPAGAPAPGNELFTGWARPAESDPALVLFTSGSSGAPKGVELSQASVIANQQNLLTRGRRLPPVTVDEPQAVALACTPFFHIGGISTVITQLITGGRLVMTVGRFDPGEVLELIEREGVQRFGGVPTMAIRVLEHTDFDRRDLTSLTSFPLGGAPVPQSLLDRMSAKLPQLARRGLANTWGMTESGGFVTVAGGRDLSERPGTVGRPYPVAELRIAEPDPAGIGEVIVRAPTVMTRYLGASDDGIDGDGWLHTGDLGRLDSAGFLFIEGRIKDIVIRGGENIACSHVEAQLLTHPEVVEAAVFGVPHPELGEELAAAVAHRPGAQLSVQELTEFLRPRLGHFEIPSRWMIGLERLPTLAGEKVDKVTLRSRLLGHR
jgi:acyl-CoA synthetase (AMP-forming)/AMP-acid ligase II